MTDVELLRQWRAMRDAQAFRQIVARYGGLVYGTCRRVLADATEAEDVTQDCFVYLASRPPRIHTSLGAWLHRLATHRSYDRLKSDGRRRVREERFAGESPATTEASMNDVLDHVDEAVDLLPDKYRHVLVSHYYLDKTHADIAKELGLSRRAVGYRIDKGLSRLREHLKRIGITAPAAALTGFMSSKLCEAAPASLVTKIGSMAVAGAATTPSASVATMLANLTSSKITISLAVSLFIAAAAWWGGTALFPDKEEPIVERAAALAVLVPSSLTEPPEDAMDANSPVVQPETQPTTSEPEESLVATEQIDSDLGSISGKVVDSEGTPLPGWTVFAQRAEGAGRSEADKSGVFTVAGLLPGEYEVWARKPPRYARANASSKVALRPGEDFRGLTIVFDLGQSLSGYVSSSDGQPIPNAMVRSWLTQRPANSGAGLTIFDAQSDASGRYVISGIPDSQGIQVNLQVLHTHYVKAIRYSVLVDGTEQDFTLFETPTIEGRVLDAVSHAPITEYRLFSWMGDSSWEDNYLLSAGRMYLETHPEGQFSFRPKRGFNQVRIAISAPGYATGLHRLENVQPGETVTEVEILLQPVAPLTGTVINSDGSPVRDAQIYLGYPKFVVRNLRSTRSPGLTQTDSDGAFVITEYPESLSMISAHHIDYAPDWIDVAKPFSPVEIVLTNGGRLEGFITYGGDPLENGRSRIYVMTGEFIIMEADTSDSGYYEFQNVPTGLMTVTVDFREGGLRRGILRDINLRSGETRRQDFDFGDAYDSYVEGTLLLNDRPVPLSVLRAIVHFENGDRVDYQTETAGDGSYRLGPIPAAVFEFGAYTILLDDGSYLYAPDETISTRSGETTHHDIILVTD